MFLSSFLVPSVPQRVAAAMLAVFPPGCSLWLVVHLQSVLMGSVAVELLKEGGCYDWFRSQELQDQWLDAPVTRLRS